MLPSSAHAKCQNCRSEGKVFVLQISPKSPVQSRRDWLLNFINWSVTLKSATVKICITHFEDAPLYFWASWPFQWLVFIAPIYLHHKYTDHFIQHTTQSSSQWWSVLTGSLRSWTRSVLVYYGVIERRKRSPVCHISYRLPVISSSVHGLRGAHVSSVLVALTSLSSC